MNSKFYVSLEAARLLKEKGYNEATNYSIDEDNCMMDSRYVLNKDLAEYVYSCPTKTEVIDWLESRGFYIDYLYTINGKWDCSIIIPSCAEIIDMGLFKTRLEAEEAAIIKALKLLENGN